MSASLIKSGNKVGELIRQWRETFPNTERDDLQIVQTVAQCYESFISGSKDLVTLAEDYKLPVALLTSWARSGGWLERREMVRGELLAQIELDYATFLRSHRTKTARELVESVGPVVKKLADVLNTVLGEDAKNVDAIDVRRYAESLKFVADVLQTTVGLTGGVPERPATAAAEQTHGKQPFFNINVMGAPQPAEKVIDVTPGAPQ